MNGPQAIAIDNNYRLLPTSLSKSFLKTRRNTEEKLIKRNCQHLKQFCVRYSSMYGIWHTTDVDFASLHLLVVVHFYS
jgi:hypothetical protein